MASPRARSTAKPTSRAAQRAGTREQIRVAAWELFSTVGFDETTTQVIAERAGVAAGTVFVHASDKADLLFMVMHDRLDAAMNERFETLPDGALLDRLMHVFSGVLRMYGEHPKMGAAFVRLLPGARGPNADRVNTMTFAFLGRIAGLVGEAQARGEAARDLEPMMCAQNIFGLYFVALLGWLSGVIPIEAVDARLRASLAQQIRGFQP